VFIFGCVVPARIILST